MAPNSKESYGIEVKILAKSASLHFCNPVKAIKHKPWCWRYNCKRWECLQAGRFMNIKRMYSAIIASFLTEGGSTTLPLIDLGWSSSLPISFINSYELWLIEKSCSFDCCCHSYHCLYDALVGLFYLL